MSKPKARAATPSPPPPNCIRLRNVRQNNLQGFDLDLPHGELIVVTGLSGSGKSSLAFETLYAEGQRRYIETFSPYARQFFDRMDKPAADRIENIPPAIAIEQRNAVRTTRSTVGTMTELCEHLKGLWTHLSQLHCRRCGQPVRRESPQVIWQTLSGANYDGPAVARSRQRVPTPSRSVTPALPSADTLQDVATPYAALPGKSGGPDPAPAGQEPAECLITFDLPLSDRLTRAEQVALLTKQGFLRVLLSGRVQRVAELPEPELAAATHLTVIVDRLRPVTAQRARFIEACEQAYEFGHGRLTVRPAAGEGPVRAFSAGFHCAPCDLEYREPVPALFSFNHPIGACPECKGFGRIITIDPALALPDHSRTLAEGVVRPWQTGMSAECQTDLTKAAKKRGVPMDVPFRELAPEWRQWVMEGDPGYVHDDPEHSWPKLWYGVKGYFRWLESKAYKMHVRVLLSRYRSYRLCPSCRGQRFQPDSLLFRLPIPSGAGGLTAESLTLADFQILPLRTAQAVVEALHARLQPPRHEPLGIVFGELRARLAFLVEIGLGYLTLDRPTRTLSGGETERVNLTTCLGSRLVNTLYVLDEPSVGLHPRDTTRLITILKRLRDLGNTVVVVEHEASVMRAADRIVDLGPGHGETGGRVVFAGPPADLATTRGSLTADYLTGRRVILPPPRRPVGPDGASPLGALRLSGATRHNLRQVAVTVPLGRLTGISGVSGSGKTTLVREVLLPLLEARLAHPGGADSETTEAEGETEETVSDGATSGSAMLTGVESLGAAVLVDQSPLGRTPRSNPAVYLGAFEDIREVFAASPAAKARGLNHSAFSFNSAVGQCERCRGAGFEKIEMQFLSDVFVRCPACAGRRYRGHILDVTVTAGGRTYSVADVLEAPVESALAWLEALPDSKPARRAAGKLRLLAEVGLGYLRLGQPINTLSGGESQRLKLASHLVGTAAGSAPGAGRPTLFVFDEPTTGLHFEDVRILLLAFQRLVDAGHTVLVIEHNLDVLRSCDWLIDLGPDAGDAGGEVVVSGTPETVAACARSQTGQFLATAA
jgi:excinuclease ABC subunit A